MERCKDSIHRKVVRWITDGDHSGMSVLDLGCGDCLLSDRLEGLGMSVDRLDILPSRDDVGFIDLNDSHTSLPSASYDVVLLVEVVEHLDNPYRVLELAHAALRPGGVLIISTPYVQSLFQRLHFLVTGTFFRFGFRFVGDHIMPVFHHAIVRRLETVGFVVEDDTFNRSVIPLLRVTAGPSRLFGDNMMIRAVKDEMMGPKNVTCAGCGEKMMSTYPQGTARCSDCCLNRYPPAD